MVRLVPVSPTLQKGYCMPHISPVLAWFLIGIVFYVVELVLPGFIVFFFGIGAWCTALVVYLTDVPLSGQLGVFLVTSLLTLFLLRKYIQSIFLGTAQDDDAAISATPVDDTGVVTEDISPPGKGRVKYGGSFWKAVADVPIPAGTTVEIVSQDNLEVKVRILTEREEV